MPYSQTKHRWSSLEEQHSFSLPSSRCWILGSIPFCFISGTPSFRSLYFPLFPRFSEPQRFYAKIFTRSDYFLSHARSLDYFIFYRKNFERLVWELRTEEIWYSTMPQVFQQSILSDVLRVKTPRDSSVARGSESLVRYDKYGNRLELKVRLSR